MKLQRVLDSLDDIPEDLHENYEKADGKFHLTLMKGHVPEKDQDQFVELKGALDKQRNDTKSASKQFQDLTSSIEALGGLETLKELIDQKADDERSNLEKKGQYDQLLDQVKKEHGLEIEKRDRVVAGLRTRLDREKRGREVMEAIAKHDANPTLLQPILMQATRLAGEMEGDDDLRVEVVVDDVPLVDGEGQPLTVEGYVQRLREDEAYAGAFKGSGSTGGGGSGDRPPGGGGGGGGNGGGIPPELTDFRRNGASALQRVAALKALATQLGVTALDDPKVADAYAALPE